MLLCILCWKIGHPRSFHTELFSQGCTHRGTVVPKMFTSAKAHGLFMSLTARENDVTGMCEIQGKADRIPAVGNPPKRFALDPPLGSRTHRHFLENLLQ